MDVNEGRKKFQFSLLDLVMMVAMAAFVCGVARIGCVYWKQIVEAINDEFTLILFLIWTIAETIGSILWFPFLFKKDKKKYE